MRAIPQVAFRGLEVLKAVEVADPVPPPPRCWLAA
jgi:hypothetical protein